MSAKVALVICNWNKRAYLEKCLNSVLRSRFRQYDVYVVDNASTDGSVEFLQQYEQGKINVIYNEINKGGSGGFNTGIQEALKGDYTYIHLLDNDVIMDELALIELVEYMNRHPDVAAAGSKLFSMDQPERLQEMGADIDWDRFHVLPHYKGNVDNRDIPEVVECDYVPACSVLIRADVIRQVGLMDEQFFIYWDDIEWFYRMKRAGYKVIAYGKSKVWHKMGAANRSNTFPTYYFWRNRVHFFARCLEAEHMGTFIQVLCHQLFDAIFFSNYKGQRNTSTTLLSGIEDAMHGIRGKAADDRILPREEQKDRFADIISRHGVITLRLAVADNNIVWDVIERIKSSNPHALVSLIFQEGLEEDFELPIIKEASAGGLTCVVCDHIVNIRNSVSDELVVYVDQYFNTVSGSEDVRQLENYEVLLQFFKQLYVPLLEQRLRALQADE